MATSFGGFGSSKQESSELTVDQLLTLAQRQGGAVGEVAAELANPRRSMLATAGKGLKNAFSGFLDLISAPGQIVAGAVSQDYTIKQTLSENIAVSDILFGDKDTKNASLGVKFQDFVARTAIDVLTDPLTFVTFGASRGILGISAVPKFFAGEELASKLGHKIKGNNVYLSEVGEKWADEYVDAVSTGNKESFFLKKQEEIFKALPEVPTGKERFELVNSLKEFDTQMSKDLTDNILNGRLRQADAVATIGKLINKHPALVETLMDKGGIKFFGKSILSSQRLRGVRAVVPGMTLMDNLTAPIRTHVGAAFSRNYRLDAAVEGGGGRVSDEVIETQQKWLDMADSMKNDLLRQTSKLYENLGITKQEDSFITAAIETGLEPADPRNAQIWATLNGVTKDGPIREEVWKAAGFVRNQFKKNYSELRQSGVNVSSFERYFPHLLVKQSVKPAFTKAGLKKTPNSSLFAKASILLDDTGKQFPTYFEAKPGIAGVVKATIKKGDGETSVEDMFVDGDNFTSTVDSKTYSRARITIKEAKDEFGINFNESSLVGMLMGSMEAIKISTGRNFLREVAEKAGVSASLAPEGYVPVNTTGINFKDVDIAGSMTDPKGEQVYFHPLVAKHIQAFAGAVAQDDATEAVLKSYDKLQNVFKATVTSIIPAFHGRNAISNVMMNFLDIGYHALDPVHNLKVGNMVFRGHQMAKLQDKINVGDANAVKKYKELMEEPVFQDNKGYNWSYGELRSVLQKNVVAFNPRNLGYMDQAQSISGDIKQMQEVLFPEGKKAKALNTLKTTLNPLSTQNAFVKKGLELGGLVEDFSRTSNFMANLKATGDPLLAAQRTKMFLFDYQNLSDFERTYLRRLIPFYTFSRKNIELQTKMLFKRPGAIAGEVRGVQTIGDAMGGEGDLTDEERANLPEWMRGGINTVVERDGNIAKILQTIGSPIEQPFQQIQPNQALASLSPILRVPAELMSGYSFFHGKAISEVTNAAAFQDAPDIIKDFIGYAEVSGVSKDGKPYTYHTSLRPAKMHFLLNLPPTQRIISEIKGLQEGGEDARLTAADVLFGFNLRDIDLESEELKRENELRQELINVLDKSNAEIYQFNRVVIPKEVQE